MAKGIRIVDEAQVVQDVDQIFIAYQGQSMEVGEVYVADQGVVRQCWPPDVIQQTGVTWTTTAEESYDTDPVTARARCSYDARTGLVTLSNYDGTERQIQAVAPAPRGQGEFLYKFEILSGSITAYFPDSNWHDVLEEGTLAIFENYLESTSGYEAGQARLSFAKDDGLGAPEAGTQVDKIIDFSAEILDGNIIMSQRPWDLDNTEINNKAEVFVLTVPAGFIDSLGRPVQTAFINGEYGFPKGFAEVEQYAVDWNSNITVQVDVISGSVLGEATGVALSTSERRVWYIEAVNPGDVVTAEIDVTIAEGAETVTKRVTMRAEQVGESTPTPPAPPPEEDFTRYDEIKAYDYSSVITDTLEAEAFITVQPDGIVDARTIPTSSLPNFPQRWFDGTPARPQDFECRVVFQTTSNSVDFRGIENVWQNCSEERQWSVRQTFSNSPRTVDITAFALVFLEIREVGRPETVSIKEVRLEARVKKP